jgi:CBS-domain-containing membrane protein
MLHLPGRLGTLRACDIMTRDVVVLKANEPLPAAFARLKENHITGAMVEDEQGKVVGLLSVSDLLRRSSKKKKAPLNSPYSQEHDVWDLFEGDVSKIEDWNDLTVGERMSASITSVVEITPLVDVAAVMCNGHWHRVPVVNEDNELCGIISSMDILAALVHTAEEEVEPVST